MLGWSLVSQHQKGRHFMRFTALRRTALGLIAILAVALMITTTDPEGGCPDSTEEE
jgi:hypothetical protein